MSHAPIAPFHIDVDGAEFGHVPSGAVHILRGHLSIDEFLGLATSMLARHGDEHPCLADARAPDVRTRLTACIDLVHRDFAQRWMRLLFHPTSPRPRYRIHTLDELRGVHDRIIFSGRAVSLERTRRW